MAKQARNTFGAMSSRLQTLGFIRSKRGESLVFTYPNGGPVILLPAYKSGEAVKPIHQVMVNRQLVDAGILEAGALPTISNAKTASRFRPAHHAKSPAEPGTPPKRGRS
jgi:hypothetical protein